LARITAGNPGGAFDEIVAAHTAAHTAYFAAITGESTAFARQQGNAVRVKKARVAFIKFVRRREGAIRNAYDSGSADYQKFFPHGLTEYTRMTLANAQQLMDRLVNALQAHTADRGAALATEPATLRDDFMAARTAQLGRTGEVGSKRVSADKARTALEFQLLSNLLFIGSKHLGNVQKCLAYFDQTILRQPVRRPRKNKEADVEGKEGAA